ncbi:hypothetical protein IAQ61_003434 [Plenodomus lingam]|uniref:uncharacterized protein n=1 Tax=Leptosphaeria maculans TaxID=5022 RepID=UPI00332DCA6B|nr:hypothetical protein IAQ61_003434 [Plenodomus lingam]
MREDREKWQKRKLGFILNSNISQDFLELEFPLPYPAHFNTTMPRAEANVLPIAKQILPSYNSHVGGTTSLANIVSSRIPITVQSSMIPTISGRARSSQGFP